MPLETRDDVPWCQSRVLGEDYKDAQHADEERDPEQGETGPLGLRETT